MVEKCKLEIMATIWNIYEQHSHQYSPPSLTNKNEMKRKHATEINILYYNILKQCVHH